MSLKIGHTQERSARGYLEQQGLKLLASNYRCKYGEIDLVMQDKDQWVFVEVRYRKTESHGSAAATVNRQKQQKIIRSAKHYLIAQNQYDKISCRFDVVALNNSIEWIPNAFLAG